MKCPTCGTQISMALIRKVMAAMGSRGGRVKGVTKRRGDGEYYSKLAKLGTAKRWKKEV